MTRLASPLFWRVYLINAVVFAAGTAVLVFSPATVSARPLVAETVVVAIGLAVLFVVNGLLLRGVLHPLDELTATLGQIDLLRPRQRLEMRVSGPALPLLQGVNAMLDRIEAEQDQSAGRALLAQEAERRRIAQELHDEVGQSLTAVLLHLRRVESEPEGSRQAALELARGTTRTALEEVRRISQRLRPGVLDDLGLLNSLSSLASDLEERSDIRVERGLVRGIPPLSDATELVLYRVAQEALTNTLRHASARTVRIGLHPAGTAVVLEVEDDGVGVRGSTPGAGIQGMTERARMVGGSLSVGAREGGGTVVRLSVPAVSS